MHILRSQAEQTMEMTEDLRAKQVRMAVTRRIKELGRAGKAREALQQLAEMARLGVQPDPMLGTALVDACARSGQMQMAQAAFEELFGDGPNSLLEPDDVTFSILVRGYGETEPPQWLAISGLLSKMQSRFNLKPSTATYNALLEVCARTKDLTRGYEIIERMERAGVLPDEQSVEAVKNRRALRTHLKRVFNF
ncbi:probable pentatricopeptide repeat-containing protein At4g19440, chloroplastic [Coccomyxa sp. Obi]|nr:probable pentatricopeptide repeat-containing protein At4g19440, chloroplastic [Coccomyxa sp. Obi]